MAGRNHLKLFRWGLSLLILLGGAVCPLTGWALGVHPYDIPVSFDVVAQGAYSGVTEAGFKEIKTPEAWEALWQQVQSTLVPVPAAPSVDFQNFEVLAVFMGQRGNGGYHIRISEIKPQRAELCVTVVSTEPGPGCLTTMALTQPYQMVLVPRLSGPVVFVAETVSRPCRE